MIETERTVVPHAVSEQSLATLEPGATVVEAARMMAYLRIGALMVVEGESSWAFSASATHSPACSPKSAIPRRRRLPT
jgi:CBS domain-containing protein